MPEFQRSEEQTEREWEREAAVAREERTESAREAMGNGKGRNAIGLERDRANEFIQPRSPMVELSLA